MRSDKSPRGRRSDNVEDVLKRPGMRCREENHYMKRNQWNTMKKYRMKMLTMFWRLYMRRDKSPRRRRSNNVEDVLQRSGVRSGEEIIMWGEINGIQWQKYRVKMLTMLWRLYMRRDKSPRRRRSDNVEEVLTKTGVRCGEETII